MSHERLINYIGGWKGKMGREMSQFCVTQPFINQLFTESCENEGVAKIL